MLTTDAKTFYKNLCVLVGPIAIQNFISALVNSADVVMLGYVGQTPLAASSLAGQVMFILFLFFTGLSSGLTMLIAQYWGKKDTDSIETLMGIGLRLSFAVALVFAVGAFFFPRALMLIFTDDEAMIAEGAAYLKIVSFAYLFLSVSQIYQCVLKSIERVKTVTVIVFIALGLNVVLNAVFIFGFFGLPQMGIRGVALATSIARAVELFLCLICGSRIKTVRVRVTNVFKQNVVLFRDFIRYGASAIGNEFVWGAAFAMYSVILGHLGSDIVAANSIINVIRNLASVLCFGMAYGGAIILGKEMGTNQFDLVKKDAARLYKSTILAGVLGAFVVLLSRPLAFSMATLSPTAEHYLGIMLYINCFSIIGAATNTVFICGIFRSGGDAKFGFILDTLIMWALSVPLGLVAAFVLKLSPIVVYLILFLDEFEKMPFIIVHYRRGKWMKNITRDFTA